MVFAEKRCCGPISRGPIIVRQSLIAILENSMGCWLSRYPSWTRIITWCCRLWTKPWYSMERPLTWGCINIEAIVSVLTDTNTFGSLIANLSRQTMYRVGGVIMTKEKVFISHENRILIKYTLVDAHSPTVLQFRPFWRFVMPTSCVSRITYSTNVTSGERNKLLSVSGVSPVVYAI